MEIFFSYFLSLNETYILFDGRDRKRIIPDSMKETIKDK